VGGRYCREDSLLQGGVSRVVVRGGPEKYLSLCTLGTSVVVWVGHHSFATKKKNRESGGGGGGGPIVISFKKNVFHGFPKGVPFPFVGEKAKGGKGGVKMLVVGLKGGKCCSNVFIMCKVVCKRKGEKETPTNCQGRWLSHQGNTPPLGERGLGGGGKMVSSLNLHPW